MKEPTQDQTSHFNWSRDSIYIALILLGAGGAIVVVIALSMIAFLVDEFKVNMIIYSILYLSSLH